MGGVKYFQVMEIRESAVCAFLAMLIACRTSIDVQLCGIFMAYVLCGVVTV